MRVYCIVCSRKKLETTAPVNAIDLYLSPNIRDVYEMSQRQGLDFRILSGKFGLLRAEQKIKTYDYLLTQDAVEELKERIKQQITSQGIEGVTFFAENRERHPNWVPYYDSIIQSCNELGINLELIEIGDK